MTHLSTEYVQFNFVSYAKFCAAREDYLRLEKIAEDDYYYSNAGGELVHDGVYYRGNGELDVTHSGTHYEAYQAAMKSVVTNFLENLEAEI